LLLLPAVLLLNEYALEMRQLQRVAVHFRCSFFVCSPYALLCACIMLSSMFNWLAGSAAEPEPSKKRARDEDDNEDALDAAPPSQSAKQPKLDADVAPGAQSASKPAAKPRARAREKKTKPGETFMRTMSDHDQRSNILQFLTLKEKTRLLMTGKPMRNILEKPRLWDTLRLNLWEQTNGKS
jgi:hypothetical protein